MDFCKHKRYRSNIFRSVLTNIRVNQKVEQTKRFTLPHFLRIQYVVYYEEEEPTVITIFRCILLKNKNILITLGIRRF